MGWMWFVFKINENGKCKKTLQRFGYKDAMTPTLADLFIVICSVRRLTTFYELRYEETTQEGTEGGF